MRDRRQPCGRVQSLANDLDAMPEPPVPSADTDEAAAHEARLRYRNHGIEPLDADDAIRVLLAPGEQVLAVRHSVALDRRLASDRGGVTDSVRGDLYLTTTRLVLIGEQVVTFDLGAIKESALAGERVLLLLSESAGVVLDVERPRLLRVQISAARAARAGGDARASGTPHPASR